MVEREDDDGDIAREVARFGVAAPLAVTYIARLHTACLAAGLEQFEPSPPSKRPPWRTVYATPEFIRWMAEDLSGIEPNDPTAAVPAAQLDAELTGFCDGDGLAFGSDIHPLEPLGSDVWQLKTPTLRLVGWFLIRNCLALHRGGDADWLHEDVGRYAPIVKSVVSFRSSLGSGLPGPMKGKRLENVLSNRTR